MKLIILFGLVAMVMTGCSLFTTSDQESGSPDPTDQIRLKTIQAIQQAAGTDNPQVELMAVDTTSRDYALVYAATDQKMVVRAYTQKSPEYFYQVWYTPANTSEMQDLGVMSYADNQYSLEIEPDSSIDGTLFISEEKTADDQPESMVFTGEVTLP